MVARLERDVCGCAAHVDAAALRIVQRFDFRMRLTTPVMPAFAERHAFAHENAADGRIRRRIGDRARAELDRAREIRGVAVYGVTSTPFQNAT